MTAPTAPVPTDAHRIIERHRNMTLVLKADTKRKVAQVFYVLQADHLDASFPDLLDATEAVIRGNHATATGTAASFVREYRTAHNLSGQPPISLHDATFDIDAYRDSLYLQSVASVRANVSGGREVHQAMNIALTNIQGMAVKRVLDGARDIIIGSSVRDTKSPGYQRVIGGSRTCDFCTMLAGRGAVYSKETGHFGAHDHCSCSAVPIYEDGRTGKASAVKAFVPSTRSISAEQKANVRNWLHNNPRT